MPANDVVSRIKYSDSQDPWNTIAETPWGDVPMWKYATLTCGNVGAYNEYMRSIRSDAADATTRIALADARADELDRREGEISARERLVQDAISKVHHLLGRADSMLSALEERRQQTTQDEEELQELETILPGGELHTIPAKQDAGPQDPDEPDPIGEDGEGDLPKDLRMPELGNYPTLEDPPKPQVAQPTAISLNAEDDDDVSLTRRTDAPHQRVPITIQHRPRFRGI
jgi:hypothetical protein